MKRGFVLEVTLAIVILAAVGGSALYASEFVTNGGLVRALAGGSRCETSSNAFGSWTLTSGATWYDDDVLKTNSMGCPGQTTLTIVQSFAMPGNLPYMLSFSHNENQYPNPGTVVWSSGYAMATVYYYSDLGQTSLISSHTTGNVVAAARNTWTTATMSKTTPSNCASVKLEVTAYSTLSGAYYGFTNIDNVSVTACVPIAITGQPQSQVKDVGQSAVFTVTATGDTPSYQWEKRPLGGAYSPIGGATGPSYATGTLALTDSGYEYRCKVYNSCTTVYSNAATLTVIAPAVVSTIATAKEFADGVVVRLPEKPVSSRTSSAYWIQDILPSTPSGIKVLSPAYPDPGARVAVTGYMRSTGGFGERWIEALTESWGTPGSEVKPYFFGTKALGGANLNANSLGIIGAEGPNNLGLLVKIYGHVRNIGSNYYYVDDGAGLNDGTLTSFQPNLGVRVVAPPGSLSVGDGVDVVGASSCFFDDVSHAQKAVVPSGCTMPLTSLVVGAIDSAVCSGVTTSVTVAGSEADVTYQLRNSAGNVPVGNAVLGTGGMIGLSTDPLTATTTFNVMATRNVGGCTAQLSQTKTVTVNPLPNAGLAVGATQTQLDVGQSTNVTVASSQVGVLYQLRRNSDNTNVGGPVAGNGSTINLPTGTYSQTGIYVYNVLAAYASSGCSRQLTQTVTITVGTLGNLTGKVMNALAQPIYGATVQLGNGIYTTTTGADGSFSFSNVVAGTYTMTASADTYQAHTWSRVIVSANRTNPVPFYYLAHNWSKMGWHIQSLQPTGLGTNFLIPVHNCGKTCQMVKGMGNLGVAETANSTCPGSFCVGRVNELPDGTQIFAFDEYFDSNGNLKPGSPSAAQLAEDVYYHGGGHGLKWLMEQNPRIHVWEVVNEWDSHYDYQSDFFLHMMDIAELDGHRIAAFSSSAGTPSLDPNYKFIGDTRTELENLARVCARAKAHGGHMLALHEYGYSGTLQGDFESNPYGNVLRYRRFHDYLAAYTATDDPANGWVGADCPIIITEACGQDCGASSSAQMADLTWYDTKVREDSYLLGVAVWNIGGECDKTNLFSFMSSYICAN